MYQMPREMAEPPPQGPPNLAPHRLASTTGTWCWTRFPLRPQPCLVPGTGTFCTQQQAMQPGQLPQTCPQARVCR